MFGGLAFLGAPFVNRPGKPYVEGASPAHAGTRSRESEQVRVSIESHLTMTTTKSLVVAALLSLVAAVSMAQTPAAPKAAATKHAAAKSHAKAAPSHKPVPGRKPAAPYFGGYTRGRPPRGGRPACSRMRRLTIA